MPVASVLERMLAAPAIIMIPMGQSSDSPHLANERIRRVNLLKVRVLECLEGWAPAGCDCCCWYGEVLNCNDVGLVRCALIMHAWWCGNSSCLARHATGWARRPSTFVQPEEAAPPLLLVSHVYMLWVQGKAVIRGLLEEVAGLWQPGAPSSDLAAGEDRGGVGGYRDD